MVVLIRFEQVQSGRGANELFMLFIVFSSLVRINKLDM